MNEHPYRTPAAPEAKSEVPWSEILASAFVIATLVAIPIGAKAGCAYQRRQEAAAAYYEAHMPCRDTVVHMEWLGRAYNCPTPTTTMEVTNGYIYCRCPRRP